MLDEAVQQNVLIVDDEPVNIKILGQLLASDCRVRTAVSGKKALEIARSDDRPDLILLDIMMPDMDGYEVCRQLKNDSRSNDIPVIFITAMDAAEEEAKGLELGAVDYIVKPFNLPIVKARVRNQLLLKKRTDLLEQLISIDGLTEVPNRRFFDQNFSQEWRRAIRQKQPISLIMLDVDHFKDFNDHYGHSRGDDCLREVARALSGQLRRSGDFVARYGGEEFAVVLPDTNLDAAQIMAERLRSGVETLSIEHGYSSVSDVMTASVGVATALPRQDSQPSELLELADDLLYQAKHAGRNQIKGQQLP